LAAPIARLFERPAGSRGPPVNDDDDDDDDDEKARSFVDDPGATNARHISATATVRAQRKTASCAPVVARAADVRARSRRRSRSC
jgi:hypothetical protein